MFRPEPVVSACMAADLADYLAARGATVTVLCPQPSRPLGADFARYLKPGVALVTREGTVEVVRLPSFAAPRLQLFARFRESYSFGREVCRHLMALGEKPDVLYVNAWPLFGQALIARRARRECIPYVLQVMDIYPESLLNKLPGFLGRLLAPGLTALDSWVANGASYVSVISENMRRTYLGSRGTPAPKVVTVNLWQDERLFAELPSKQAACARYGVPADRFTFLYLGNIGPVAGVDFLIRAFHAAGLEAAQLVIVGDGSAKNACLDLVRLLSAGNVRFISDQEVANVPLLQSMADVCLLPMARGTGMSSIPSKLSAYMLSGKPVLATVETGSDTANVILQADCGWIGDSEDLHWLAAKMGEVSALAASALCSLGQNGRQFGLANFSKTNGVSRLGELILSARRQ